MQTQEDFDQLLAERQAIFMKKVVAGRSEEDAERILDAYEFAHRAHEGSGMMRVVAIEGTSFPINREDFFEVLKGLTYFLKFHIIIVQGRQRRVSAKALKHNSVPECLVM